MPVWVANVFERRLKESAAKAAVLIVCGLTAGAGTIGGGSETITITSKSSSSSVGSASSSTSEQSHGRPLLTPDELRRLSSTEVLVLEQGIPPVRFDRLDYRSDAESAKLWDENPTHNRQGER